MKISYHRRRKIKTRRIALRDLILRGIEDPKDLAKELKCDCTYSDKEYKVILS